jgi:hypothetical protein
MAFFCSLLAAEATLLYGSGIAHLSQLTFATVLQMVITGASVTLPWLGYSPRETPIGAPPK